MKVILEIPKEFEKDILNDKLCDFWGRVSADLENNSVLCGLYEKEILDMLDKAFEKAEIEKEELKKEEKASFEKELDNDKKYDEQVHEEVEEERVEGNRHEEDQRRVHKPFLKR